MATEIEAKFLGIDPVEIRLRLERAWFVRETEDFLMARKTFHSPSYGPSEWIRVRREAEKTTMTYKKIHALSLGWTEEIEIVVDDFDRACELLEKTGLAAKSYQENFREVWRRENVEVCIDRWPGLAPYIEIEAKNAEGVERVARELGYSMADAYYGGTETVYGVELGIPPDELVRLPRITFDAPPLSRK